MLPYAFLPSSCTNKKDHLITEEHASTSLLDLDNTGTSIPEVNNIKF